MIRNDDNLLYYKPFLFLTSAFISFLLFSSFFIKNKITKTAKIVIIQLIPAHTALVTGAAPETKPN